VVDARISTVSFSGGTEVNSDADVKYGATQWTDAKTSGSGDAWPDGAPDDVPNRPQLPAGATQDPDKVMSYPYSYTQDATPKASAYFATKNPRKKRVEAMGKATTSSCTFEFPRKDAPGGAYPATTATAKIVDDGAIHCFTTPNRRVERNGMPEQASLDIQWTVWIDGQEIDAGVSKHTIYVTSTAPTTPLRQETLFNLSCAMANGKKASTAGEQKAVFEAIWSDFADRAVRRMDGAILKYWGASAYNDLESVAILLKTGDGPCGRWSNFLVESTRAHGINLATRCGIEPKPISIQGIAPSPSTLVIQTYTTTAQPLPKSITLNQLSRSAHKAAQGNPQPSVDTFVNHAVNRWKGEIKIYDPSYGINSADLDDWESTALSYVLRKYPSPTNPAQAAYVLFPITKGTEDCSIAEIP
jgi:hypothetical protein